MKYYVVVEKDTREVLACISDNSKDDILRKDVDLKVYEGCGIQHQVAHAFVEVFAFICDILYGSSVDLLPRRSK